MKALLPTLLRAYVTNGNSLLPVLCLPALQLLVTSPVQLLKFKPLYYDGVALKLEIAVSLGNIWDGSHASYSTHYGKERNFRTKRLCAAYFSGVAGEDWMSQRVHFDLNLVSQFPCVQLKRFIYRPEAQAVAIVREVSVARPKRYTGAVKTLMVLVGTRPGSEYNPEEFKKWEHLDSVEKAQMVDERQRLGTIDHVTFIEYAPAAEDYYPLLWVQFSDLAHNPVSITLSRPHAIRQTTVMLYNIEDRREEPELLSMQPDFYGIFVVLRGAVARGSL